MRVNPPEGRLKPAVLPTEIGLVRARSKIPVPSLGSAEWGSILTVHPLGRFPQNHLQVEEGPEVRAKRKVPLGALGVGNWQLEADPHTVSMLLASPVIHKVVTVDGKVVIAVAEVLAITEDAVPIDITRFVMDAEGAV